MRQTILNIIRWCTDRDMTPEAAIERIKGIAFSLLDGEFAQDEAITIEAGGTPAPELVCIPRREYDELHEKVGGLRADVAARDHALESSAEERCAVGSEIGAYREKIERLNKRLAEADATNATLAQESDEIRGSLQDMILERQNERDKLARALLAPHPNVDFGIPVEPLNVEKFAADISGKLRDAWDKNEELSKKLGGMISPIDYKADIETVIRELADGTYTGGDRTGIQKRHDELVVSRVLGFKVDLDKIVELKNRRIAIATTDIDTPVSVRGTSAASNVDPEEPIVWGGRLIWPAMRLPFPKGWEEIPGLAADEDDGSES